MVSHGALQVVATRWRSLGKCASRRSEALLG
jgi:hypothetical protein